MAINNLFNSGFKRLLIEVQGMNLEQLNHWLKNVSLDELDDIVFSTEYIAKQAVKEMAEKNQRKL